MTRTKLLCAAVLCTLALSTTHAGTVAEQDCQAIGDLEPICGFRGSEDLEVLPDGRGLLVSESRIDFDASGSMVWQQGGIAFLDLATKHPVSIYHAGPRMAGPGPWGDRNCPGNIGDALSPHGIHLSRRKDGKWQLLVVNHGGRESVEFFEVRLGARGTPAVPQLVWHGCLALAATQFPNDTVAMPDGGLLVTDMAFNSGPKTMLMESISKAARGENTGQVLRWRPGHGVEIVAGTASPIPNGIQVDRSGRTLFIGVGGATGGEVRKIDLASGKLLGTAAVPHPDNLSWSSNGRLLVAGILHENELGPCFAASTTIPCPAAMHVTAVDPETLSTETLLNHAGPPMGAATGAVQAGDFLYVGSFAGGRILKAPLRRP